MTIGDKIKYCRTRNRLSQAKLAELSGISLVSIKRYETNKAIPLPPQIKKLADVLGIGALAFSDTYFDCLQELETYGDLTRLLIIFRKNRLIQIDGERDDDGQILPATAVFKLNPIIGAFFSVVGSDTLVRDMAFRLADETAFPQQLLADLLKWERIYTKYESLVSKYKASGDESVAAFLKEEDDVLGKIEIELQYNSVMLMQTDGHITIKINPDYGNEEILAKSREKAIAKELKSQTKKSRPKKDDKK